MKRYSFVLIFFMMTLLLLTLTLVACEQPKECSHQFGSWQTLTPSNCTTQGTQQRYCTICNYTESRALPLQHEYSSEWSFDQTSHWHATSCGHEAPQVDKAEHTYDERCDKCTVCNFWRTTPTLTYELSADGTYYVVTGSTDQLVTSLVIPDTYNNLPVKAIGNNAFSGYKINYLRLPSQLRSIGDYAFSVDIADGTDTLEIVIPNSVTTLGVGTFSSIDTYQKQVKISFESNSQLVTLPQEVFYSTNIVEITIPNGVATLGNGAFADCQYLTEIHIPSSVKTIGDGCFSSCANLRKVDVQDISAWNGIDFGQEGASPFQQSKFDKYLYLNGQLVTHLIVPQGVTTINSYVFAVDGIQTVTIPASVTTIEQHAFSNCKDLQQVVFQGQSQLQIIKSNAFYGCNNLYSMTIPANVTQLESSAFGMCNKLLEVYNLSDLTITIGETSNGGVARCAKEILTVEDRSNFTTTADGFLFYVHQNQSYLVDYVGTNQQITLPSSFDGGNYQIVNYALFNDDFVTSVTIPEGINVLPENMFNGCDNLSTVIMADSVTTVGDALFYQCASLTNVVLSQNLGKISSNMFWGCENLKQIILTESIAEIDSRAFAYCTLLESVSVPVGVQIIGEEAFRGCMSLQTLTLQDGLQTICQNAFDSCDKLQSVYFEGNVQKWLNLSIQVGSNGIIEKTNPVSGRDFYVNGELLVDLVVEDITKINDYVLNGTKLRHVLIGDTVVEIGKNAFSNCADLVSVQFDQAGVLTTIGAGAFMACESLWSVCIPDSVTTIETQAFYDCSALISVIIGKNVQTVKSFAFKNCTLLIEVYDLAGLGIRKGDGNNNGSIGAHVKHVHTDLSEQSMLIETQQGFVFYVADDGIQLVKYVGDQKQVVLPDDFDGQNYNLGAYAFCANQNVVEITISHGVTNLLPYCVSKCSNLQVVNIPSSVLLFNENVFSDCENLCLINYGGTIAQWEQIVKLNKSWTNSSNCVVKCTDGETTFF